MSKEAIEILKQAKERSSMYHLDSMGTKNLEQTYNLITKAIALLAHAPDTEAGLAHAPDDEFLAKLAERLQIPDADTISFDEIAEWPDGKLDELVEAGVLAEIQHSKGVVCRECEENCFKEPDIRTIPDTGEAAGIFVCIRNPDIGRIEVDLNRLKQWKISGEKLEALGYTNQSKEEVHAQHHIRIEQFLQRQEEQVRVDSLLERASQKAIRTGKREDLRELFRLRRELL